MEQETRRRVLLSGLALTGAALIGPALPLRKAARLKFEHAPLPGNRVPAQAAVPSAIRPELLAAALASLERHGGAVDRRDRIAIADFAAASSEERFHFLNVEDGRTLSMHVAHGSGSDPDHSGWVRRFSNDYGSNASSEGAFVTRDYYVGKHGRSQRIVGLDQSNSNALGRALVIHGAWYADASILKEHGKLGRSQGCFAVADHDLQTVFAHLGPGRMIYAAKA